LCPHRKVQGEPGETEKKWLKKPGCQPLSTAWLAQGCEHCHHTGYHGCTGIFELWLINPQGYQLLLDGADRRTLYRDLNERHHRFLIDDGLESCRGRDQPAESQAMDGLRILSHIDML